MESMEIDKAAWHCRVYLWWYRHKYGYPNERGVSNLCPYMRAVMFWAPLRAVFGNWVTIGPVPINALTIPGFILSVPVALTHFNHGVGHRLWVIYGIVLLGFIGLCVLTGCIYLISVDGQDITLPIRRSVKRWGFWDLVGEYLHSAHDRVCPEIHWKLPSSKS